MGVEEERENSRVRKNGKNRPTSVYIDKKKSPIDGSITAVNKVIFEFLNPEYASLKKSESPSLLWPPLRIRPLNVIIPKFTRH